MEQGRNFRELSATSARGSKRLEFLHGQRACSAFALPHGGILSRHAWVITLFAIAACGGGGVGAVCETRDDCAAGLQCPAGYCVAACERSPDCGDGYHCVNGNCNEGNGTAGTACQSEGDCTPGLACLLAEADSSGTFLAQCQAEPGSLPYLAPCGAAADCRSGTCAVGRCLDLCETDVDCARDNTCSIVPEALPGSSRTFHGCLPQTGTLSYEIASTTNHAVLAVAVPARARGIVATVLASESRVGFSELLAPDGAVLFSSSVPAAQNLVRHTARESAASLMLPSSPDTALQSGVYLLGVTASEPGSRPRTRIEMKLGDEQGLAVRIYMLNLAEHDCAKATSAAALLAEPAFADFGTALRAHLSTLGITLATLQVFDLNNRPDLDALEAASAPELFAQGATTYGVNMFFVRHINPGGRTLLLGGTPGDPMSKSGQSGIVLGMDALCYQSWAQLARTAGYGIARQLGLSPTIDLGGTLDPIADSGGDETNLLYGSELGGNDITPGQRFVVQRNPALQ